MKKLSSKLDWNRMLGFEQIAGERSQTAKLEAKVGIKPVDMRIGAKVGIKPLADLRIGAKVGIKPVA